MSKFAFDLKCPICNNHHLRIHSILVGANVRYEWECGWCGHVEGDYESHSEAKQDYERKYGGKLVMADLSKENTREDVLLSRELWVQKLLESIGEDPNREGLVRTPYRVAKMYDEVFGGYAVDPKKLLETTFKEDAGIEEIEEGQLNYNQGMVIVRDISFYSHCEHHMVPFFGKVHVGYIPGKKVVGLSKIARVVDAYARRLQIQERMTKQIADVINEVLEPQGVIVVIEAEHLCMKMRGVKNPCADTVTSAVRGAFQELPTRMEFLQLIRSSK